MTKVLLAIATISFAATAANAAAGMDCCKDCACCKDMSGHEHPAPAPKQ